MRCMKHIRGLHEAGYTIREIVALGFNRGLVKQSIRPLSHVTDEERIEASKLVMSGKTVQEVAVRFGMSVGQVQYSRTKFKNG